MERRQIGTTRRMLLMEIAGLWGIGSILLSACRRPAQPPPSAPLVQPARGPVLVMLQDDIGADVREQQLARLQERQPALQLKTERWTGNRFQKLVVALAAGSGIPDVFHFVPASILELASKQAIVGLDALIRRDAYDIEDFHAPTVEQYRWKGTLYSIPWPGVRALYVNVDLFGKAGAALPPVSWNQPAWTYEAFVDLARRLTVPGEPPQFGFDWSTDYRGWGPIVFALGGELFSRDLRKVLLTQPPGVAALQFLQDLRYKFAVAPTPQVYQQYQTSNVKLFKEGRTAMFFYWAAALNEFRSEISAFTFDVRPMPRSAGGAVTSGGGQGWSIAAQSRAIDAAWEVLKFLGSRENMEVEMHAGITPPARKSLADSPAWTDPVKPPRNNRVFADGFAYIRVDPLLLNWNDVQAAMQAEIDKLLTNQQSASATAAAIKDRVEPLLEENARLLGL